MNQGNLHGHRHCNECAVDDSSIRNGEGPNRSQIETAQYVSGAIETFICDMNIPALYQYDYRQRICTIGGEDKSVATSGCGATCASMVIAYLTGDTRQTPHELFKWAYENGRYHGDGLDHDTVSRLCANYGISCVWHSNSEQNVLDALQSGCPVIANMGPGIFTKEGHYIVLRAVTADGEILVNDPNSAQRTDMAFSLSTIIGQLRESNSIGVCRLSGTVGC